MNLALAPACQMLVKQDDGPCCTDRSDFTGLPILPPSHHCIPFVAHRGFGNQDFPPGGRLFQKAILASKVMLKITLLLAYFASWALVLVLVRRGALRLLTTLEAISWHPKSSSRFTRYLPVPGP